MRENHLQTPQKEHLLANRRSKSMSEQAKKPQKISKKCLNSVFTSVSEDVSVGSPKDSIDFSSISEVYVDGQFGDSAESFTESVNPEISPSLETAAPSQLTPLSSTITVNNDENGSVSVNRCRSAESNSVKIGSIEEEMVINHLRQARIEILNSANLQSKKLLDALVKVVIEEFCGLPEEKDQFSELLSTKAHLVLLSFFLWILAVVGVFFFSFGVRSSFNGLAPT
ncbi:uncharacterized protein LOC132273517 [Cornus florida]|uniref:uncharacterized protein LOC132273517 n=1 Tax=Cornus florida TaxID=4283 RepID=UPI002899A4DC|nr:uncharacterized protein LOC132273517 [Cornus florida]